MCCKSRVAQLAERQAVNLYVGSSTLSSGANLRIAQPGRAHALEAGGRMFESCCGDQLLGYSLVVKQQTLTLFTHVRSVIPLPVL